MSDIKVVKHDEVFLRVFCEDSIARELSEYFTFEVPGAKFQPAYKARLWDGRKRLYNLQTKTLYVGLLSLLKNFAKKCNYTLEIDENLSKSNQISQEKIWRLHRQSRKFFTPYQTMFWWQSLNYSRLSTRSNHTSYTE